MSVIKRIDVKDYLAARRRRKNGPLQPTSLPVGSGISDAKPQAPANPNPAHPNPANSNPANPNNENLVAGSFKQPAASVLENPQTVAVPSFRSALLSPVSRKAQR